MLTPNSQSAPEQETHAHQYLTFQAAPDIWHAMESQYIKNIIVLKEPLEATAVAGSPDYILGVYIHGSELVTAIHIATWLGIANQTPEMKRWIGIELSGHRFALEVFALGELTPIENFAQLAAEDIHSQSSQKIKAIVHLPSQDALCGIIDMHTLIDHLSNRLPAKPHTSQPSTKNQEYDHETLA